MVVKVGVALVCALLLGQLIPVGRENPPVESEMLLWCYVTRHAEARLGEDDRRRLRAWALVRHAG